MADKPEPGADIDRPISKDDMKRGRIVMLVIILAVIFVVVAVGWLISNAMSTGEDNPNLQEPDNVESTTVEEADPVKETGGASGDTQPSSDGAGSGSDNTLMNQ